MAAHWDINSPCAGTQPEAGKNLSVREGLNLEKAKNKKRKTKSEKQKAKTKNEKQKTKSEKVKVGSGGLKIKFVFI